MEIRALLQPWRRSTPASAPADAAAESGEARNDEIAEELRIRREEIARMEEQALEDRERNLARQVDELKRAKQVQRRELERVSGLTAAEARQLLVSDVEQEARHQAALRLQEIEKETKREAERRARSILSVAMQRLAGRHASDNTTRLVELPSDGMKGRIIGREGRNIRALERLTGV